MAGQTKGLIIFCKLWREFSWYWSMTVPKLLIKSSQSTQSAFVVSDGEHEVESDRRRQSMNGFLPWQDTPALYLRSESIFRVISGKDWKVLKNIYGIFFQANLPIFPSYVLRLRYLNLILGFHEKQLTI